MNSNNPMAGEGFSQGPGREDVVGAGSQERWRPAPQLGKPSHPAPPPPRPPPSRYRSGVEQVGAADVLAAARRHLHPDRQTVVVAGDAAVLRPQLEALGLPVEDLQLAP